MSAGRRQGEQNMKHDHETRISLLEQTNTHIFLALERIEKRFDKMEEKMNAEFKSVREEIKDVRGEIKDIKKEIKEIKSEGWAQMRWILMFIIAFMGSPILINIVNYFRQIYIR